MAYPFHLTNLQCLFHVYLSKCWTLLYPIYLVGCSLSHYIWDAVTAETVVATIGHIHRVITALPQNNDTNTFFFAASTQIGNSTHFAVNCLISHSFQADYCFLRFIMMQTIITWLWNEFCVSNFNIDEVQLQWDMTASKRSISGILFWYLWFTFKSWTPPQIWVCSKHISWCDSNTMNPALQKNTKKWAG